MDLRRVPRFRSSEEIRHAQTAFISARSGAIVFAVVSPAPAQGLALPFIGGPYSGGATYAGPVGVVASPIEFWGFRCARKALATGTTKVANIVRASDSTATDIVCSTSGAFDTAAAKSRPSTAKPPATT